MDGGTALHGKQALCVAESQDAHLRIAIPEQIAVRHKDRIAKLRSIENVENKSLIPSAPGGGSSKTKPGVNPHGSRAMLVYEKANPRMPSIHAADCSILFQYRGIENEAWCFQFSKGVAGSHGIVEAQNAFVEQALVLQEDRDLHGQSNHLGHFQSAHLTLNNTEHTRC